MAKKRLINSQFVTGALVGAAVAYYFLQRNAAPTAQPVVRPVPGGTLPPALPAPDALGQLPPYTFRPRTKMYV